MIAARMYELCFIPTNETLIKPGLDPHHANKKPCSNQLGTYNGAHAFSKTANENSRHLMGKKIWLHGLRSAWARHAPDQGVIFV
jgi:hypothetical protein